MAVPENVEGMARFGITPRTRVLGIQIPKLRALAKKIGRDHQLAAKLWKSGVHDARVLACLVDDPSEVSEKQMEDWVRSFDSWDVCDGCCSNLFDKTPMAHRKALEWSSRREEFVKRAGFVLMAALSVHDKEAGDEEFLEFLPVIVREADDERNFVRKAVNWSLRQIGKRSMRLNKAAIATAEKIAKSDSSAAKWIASDALRELRSKSVQARLTRTARARR